MLPATSSTFAAPVAAEICRGTMRSMLAMGWTAVQELPLANGRRADLVALDRTGELVIVEVKSCRADFLADRKWPDYLDFCDRFYFAVGIGFPLELLPEAEGLIIADRYGAEITRSAVVRPLGAARRKAMLIRLARAAAMRLQLTLDPELDLAALDQSPLS
ncbi:MAG TPA: MmcB family DNA repair protein [Geminicoccaceae bacterium]